MNGEHSNNSGANDPSGGMQIFFGKIPATGTQEAVDGIRFDFNDGLRVFTSDNGKNYLLRVNDLDTKSLLYEIVAPSNATVVSLKKYYVNFRLVISEPETDKLLFMHDFNAKAQTVMVQFPVHTLGDSIGRFSYVERFQEKTGCKIVVENINIVLDLLFSTGKLHFAL
ncbi:MAG: hypothetical protein PHI85_06885 [Victivallaceae bacterium]|nr:hypothetical protein [Victivallaceae bacterium]